MQIEWEISYLFLVHFLFYGGCHDQSIDHDIFFLTYSEGAVHGLPVLRGIPRRVEYNYPVRPYRGEINMV